MAHSLGTEQSRLANPSEIIISVIFRLLERQCERTRHIPAVTGKCHCTNKELTIVLFAPRAQTAPLRRFLLAVGWSCTNDKETSSPPCPPGSVTPRAGLGAAPASKSRSFQCPGLSLPLPSCTSSRLGDTWALPPLKESLRSDSQAFQRFTGLLKRGKGFICSESQLSRLTAPSEAPSPWQGEPRGFPARLRGCRRGQEVPSASVWAHGSLKP